MVKLSQKSIQIYQRSLFLFKDDKEALNVFEGFLNHLISIKKYDTNGLVILNEGLTNEPDIQRIYRKISLFDDIKILFWNKISSVLGKTFDFLFMDLRKEFNPNKINIALETVRGGGIIIILGLEKDKWINSVNNEFNTLEAYSDDKIKGKKSILLDWFLKNIDKNPKCLTKNILITDIVQKFNPMPYYVQLNEKFRDICVSREQKEVIENLINYCNDMLHSDSCKVLVANRGRGKSSAVGLALAHISCKKKSYKVMITAPQLENVQVIFEFILLGLMLQQIKHKIIRKDSLIFSIIISSNIKFIFFWPSEIKENKSDIFVVDEAASISLNILKIIIRSKAKKILISTIHGYEGAGRGFQYKILKYLKNQTKIKYDQMTLSQPIRYIENDLIEKLINDTFLLDIEVKPFKIGYKEIIPETLSLVEYTDPNYLFSDKGFPELKQLFGILINAHYRNQPNDLLILADLRNHFLIGIYGENREKEKNLLVSSQLAREGRMKENLISSVDSGKFILGNLIPSIAIRHFSKEFAELKGLRIVRIAVHPDIMDKGFGRLAISLHIKKFHSYDWIGVSYGATVKLVKFWKKFGFKSVHIRPIITPETGEWNIIVIKPISDSAIKIIDSSSSDFLFQFIALLRQSLHSMNPELVLQIIRSCNTTPNYEPRITVSGKYRLKNYLKGNLNFILTVDVLYEIVTNYFVISPSIRLSNSQETLLIARILQGRTWSQTLSQLGLDWKTANTLLEKAIVKLANLYLEEKK